MKEARRIARLALVSLLALGLGGCSAPAEEEDDQGTPAGGSSGGADPGTSGATGGGAGNGAGDDGTTGMGMGAGTSGGSDPGGAGASGGAGTSAAAGSAAPPVEPPPAIEMLPEGVDWEALTVGAADSNGVVHPHMYSAWNGVQTFKVPARVEGATVELSGWVAVPSSAVLFEEDPESMAGGVMITVLEAVPEITIGAMTSDMLLGGAATLHVLAATEQDWIDGEARYNNGVDYMIPMLSFTDLLDPNYMPPEPPDNLACNNCHTTGAKYFEIQHTPSQIAYISNADLITIFTMGVKPPGVAWSIIPPELEHLYVDFHTWEAPMDQQEKLIVYLRSLTPVVQGEILIPDTFTM
jgi:hypothetical protein